MQQKAFGRSAPEIPTIAFTDDSFHGQDGCNSFQGTYFLSEDGDFKITDYFTTMRYCPILVVNETILEDSFKVDEIKDGPVTGFKIPDELVTREVVVWEEEENPASVSEAVSPNARREIASPPAAVRNDRTVEFEYRCPSTTRRVRLTVFPRYSIMMSPLRT